MGKYVISVKYRTGNSFGSNDTTDILELAWDRLDVAKENLQRIKEHYEMYRELNSYRSYRKDRNDIFKENINKNWFVNVPKLYSISHDMAITEGQKVEGDWEFRPDDNYGEHCFKLIADNGNEMQMMAFWCGHFEQLYSAEIICAEDDELKIEF